MKAAAASRWDVAAASRRRLGREGLWPVDTGLMPTAILSAPPAAAQITALGRAVRRRDIPTLRESKAAEREAAGVTAEVSKEGGEARAAAWACAERRERAARQGSAQGPLRAGCQRLRHGGSRHARRRAATATAQSSPRLPPHLPSAAARCSCSLQMSSATWAATESSSRGSAPASAASVEARSTQVGAGAGRAEHATQRLCGRMHAGSGSHNAPSHLPSSPAQE